MAGLACNRSRVNQEPGTSTKNSRKSRYAQSARLTVLVVDSTLPACLPACRCSTCDHFLFSSLYMFPSHPSTLVPVYRAFPSPISRITLSLSLTPSSFTLSLSLSLSLRTVMRITRLVSFSFSFSLGPSSVGWRKFSTAGWILRWKMESLEATRGMERERKRERGNGFPRLVVKLLR